MTDVEISPVGWVRSSLDQCVKCTICESACPVMEVTGLFLGPKTVGPQAERFRTGEHSPDHSVDYCSGCGICTRVCPQGVRIAEINSRARAQLRVEHGSRIRDQLIARPEVMGRLARPVAPIFNWAMSNRWLRAVGQRMVGIHRLAPVPRANTRTLEYRLQRRRPRRLTGQRVVYFHGCSTNYFEPRVGLATIAVLEHNGFRVEVPRQGCCGLPLQSNGLYPAAREYVRRLTSQLSKQDLAGLDVIATSTSCGLMVKREAIEILGVEDRAVKHLAARTYDVFEFLRSLHESGKLRTDFTPLPLTVAYHAPCQQQNQQMGKPVLDILSMVPGLKLVELDRGCCGIAGTYGTKVEKYEIAMRVGAPLFGDIREVQPDLVLCDSETCRWQISHGTGVASVHPVEILYQAYGGR
ncbi:MAG: anaerobic glycerol-3-phosphate dehydrogenase subunit C [Candidatus Dormiibacterota bacterium]